MKYPVRNTAALKRLHVAALDGGINRRDAAHLIDDRQLCDAENVWWKDGRLQVRPAFQTNDAGLRLISSPLTVKADGCTVHTIATGCVANKDGKYGEYVAAIRHLNGTEHGYAAEYEISLLLDDGTRIDTETLLVTDGDTKRDHQHLLIVQGRDPYKNIGTFAFIDGGRLFQMTEIVDIVSFTPRYYWMPVHPTVPTVLTAGRGFRSSTGSPKDAAGTVVRSFNRLTDHFRATYTTDGESNAFVLPLNHAPAEVTAITFTDNEGVSHTFGFNATQGEFTFAKKTVTMSTVGNTVRLTIGGDTFAFPASDTANNLVIEARYSAAEEVRALRADDLQTCTWFGGTGGGLTGGSRLFVGGARELCWSAPNDPLDFPTSNYAVVGEMDEAITAFGKQSDMLVIFKEHSMYATTYSPQTVSVDEVASGGVVDLQSASAVFPITPLHAFVGCDCPHTVALCDNRLVWATSQRKVYTLTAANAFSECNVLEISDLVRSIFDDLTPYEMQTAVACDCDGYYLLFAGSMAAVLYYGKNSFGSLSGASAAKRAALTWYAWSYPATKMQFIHAMNLGREPVLLALCRGTNGAQWWATVTFGDGLDCRVNVDGKIEHVPICGSVQTKLFDFGQPEQLKRIQKLYPDAENGGQWVWITDDGKYDEHTDGACAVMTPHLPITARFGARVSFSGKFSLTGITVIYQTLDERKR